MNFNKVKHLLLISFFSTLISTIGYSQSACTLSNYGASTVVPATAYPYFSPGTGITVSASAPGVSTLSDFSYACSGVSYNCANPAWWLNSSAQTITLTFSAPVTSFSVIVNGTNDGEEFYFNSVSPCPGTISLSSFCPSGEWVTINGGKDLLYTGMPASSSLITINNTSGATVYTLKHNGVGSGSRIALVDCIVPGPPLGGGSPPVITAAGPFCVTAAAVNLAATPIGGTWSGTGITNASLGTFNPATAGVGTKTITYTTAGGCPASETIDIVVTATPSLIDPVDQVVCANTNSGAVNFSGPIAGTSYTWSNNTPSIGLPATGSGNIAPFTTANAGTTPLVATITVTPAAGGCTGPAQTFTITANPTPTVVDPVDQVLCANSTTTAVNFSGSLTGTTYNWSNNSPSIGLAAVGTGNITAFNAVNTGSSPVIATITITPTLGGCAGSPQTFTITVNPLPVFTLTPADPSVCNGTDGTITIGGLNVSTNYNITYTGTGVVGPNPMMSSGTGEIIIAGLTAGTYSGFTVALGSCTTVSPTIITLINPNPPVVGAGIDQTICEGTSVTLTANNPDGSIITWNNGVTDGVAFVPAVGTLTYTATADLAGCISTDQVDITVNPMPTVVDPLDQVLCANTNTTAVNFTGVVAGTAYNWTNTATSIGLAASGSGNITAFNAINSGTTTTVATIVVTPVAMGCTGTPQTFTITVNPIPTVVDPLDQVLCANTNTVATNFLGDVTGTIFNWTNNTPSIGLAAAGSGNIVAFNTVNTGTTPVVATITVTPSAASCIGTAQNFTFTVNPTPTVIDPVDQVLCTNASTNAVTFAGAIPGTLYNWANTATSIGLAASGTGNINSFNAINTGTVPIVSTITVTPTINGCDGIPQTFTITVNPLPTVAFVSDINSGCTPLTVNFNNLSSPTGNDCQWTFGDGTVSTGCSGASYTYTSSGLYNVGLTVTTLEGCTSAVNYPSYIEVVKQPVAAFTYTPNSDITIVNTLVQFENESLFADNYTWDFGDASGSTVTNPNHVFPIVGNITYTVTLTAENSLGCSDVAEATITVEDQILFFIPNAFTPDGNEINNIFLPVFTSGYDAYDYHFIMFDRWGEILFESYNVIGGWDGTYGNQGLVDDGVYIWQVEFRETMSDKRHTFRGHVTVLK